MKIGWWRVLGMFVLVTTMPYFAHAQKYESIISPPANLPERLDDTLGGLGVSHAPPANNTVVHDDWSSDEPAPVRSSGQLIDNGAYYAETDFTVMHRTRAGDILLGTDRQDNNKHFTTRDRDMGIQPGAKFTLGRYLPRDDESRDRSVEFTFIGLNSWDVPHSLRAASSGSITSGLGDITGGFLDADQYTTLYHSSFNSFEIDYRIGNRLGRDQMVLQPDGCWERECRPGPLHDVILGLRMINIDENFRWLSRRDDFPTDEYRGDFLVKTNNPLLGLQVGLDCYEQYCNWSWGVRGQGGIYANFSSQDTHVFENRPVLDNNGDVTSVDRSDRRYSQSEPAPAFLGEIALNASYQITSRWTFTAEYDFMFFQGLALAPEQVTFDNNEPVPPIVNDGWIIYQSLSLGMRMVW